MYHSKDHVRAEHGCVVPYAEHEAQFTARTPRDVPAYAKSAERISLQRVHTYNRVPIPGDDNIR